MQLNGVLNKKITTIKLCKLLSNYALIMKNTVEFLMQYNSNVYYVVLDGIVLFTSGTFIVKGIKQNISTQYKEVLITLNFILDIYILQFKCPRNDMKYKTNYHSLTNQQQLSSLLKLSKTRFHNHYIVTHYV